ncbi:hypothetical protein CLOM_g322 [Closterium sp. NIES-68]|nr:hypothetical protein CLOM_g322 [Closterium sp. NIES-68]
MCCAHRQAVPVKDTGQYLHQYFCCLPCSLCLNLKCLKIVWVEFSRSSPEEDAAREVPASFPWEPGLGGGVDIAAVAKKPASWSR